MCGIIGISAKTSHRVGPDLYDSLVALQHRGQDACGIITYDTHFHLIKNLGLVREIFNDNNITNLRGNVGIGHVRYSTVGAGTAEDTQPLTVNTPYGIAMVHNGNITNYDEVKKDLEEKDLRHISSGCDVDLILNVFAGELSMPALAGRQKIDPFAQQIFNAVAGVYRRIQGSYSVVALIADKGLIAFRDPYGIKPLVWGRKGNEYIFASENTMFGMLGFKHMGDVQPGECIFIDSQKKMHRRAIVSPKHHPCIFEYVYFARPDALLDDISVYKSRLRMGNKLSKRLLPLLKKLKVDVIIPAPTTSNTAALTLAYDLNIKYREGLIKNQFVGRTFIMHGQKNRKRFIRYKLAPVELEIKNKNVLLLDDSIVRGNTSKKIVELLKEYGAKKVYFIVCSPPLKYPCVYGIDMPTRQELLAHNNKSIKQIQKEIGADFLMYQTLEDLIDSVQKGNPKIKNFCTACFSGQYPTNITQKELIKLEKNRIRDRKKDEQQLRIFR